jgi:hypothetical protein
MRVGFIKIIWLSLSGFNDSSAVSTFIATLSRKNLFTLRFFLERDSGTPDQCSQSRTTGPPERLRHIRVKLKPEFGMRLRFAVAADVSSAPSKIRPKNNEPTHAGCHRSFGLAGARLVPSRSTSADTSRPAIPNVNHLPRAASWDNSRSKRPLPRSKAPEGWRTPRRFAFFQSHKQVSSQFMTAPSQIHPFRLE